MQLIIRPLLIYLLLFQTVSLVSAKPPSECSDLSHVLLGKEYSVELMESYQTTIAHLEKKQHKYRRASSFLKHMFYYVHRKHLKRYQQFSLLTDVMKSGTYDCVSASALYALLLERLGFSYQIWEMDYHIYLSVDLGDRTIVLEATDPLYGFIEQPEEINEHRENLKQKAQTLHWEVGNTTPLIYRSITLTQLAGLQLYNRAINAWTRQQKKQAKEYAEQALNYYTAERIVMLANLVSQ
ncbi:MAG: hypothetical protein AAF632_02955 [Bacteroidota bacterium]